jgi:lambda family phage portal protein
MIKAGHYTELGYRAARVARTDGRTLSPGGSGDYHLRFDRETLVKESQSFDRDNGLYEGVINRAVDNIIGDGFSLQARTDDPKVNKEIERLWSEEFTPDPEVRGLDSWYDNERLVLRHLLVDGDVAALKTTVGKFQFIEAERIASTQLSLFGRRIESGVEINDLGRPIGFYICSYDRMGYLQKGTAKRFRADDICYLANRKRNTQTRGVPALVSNFSMFHRINDVCDSEAIAWQMLARFAVAINRDRGPELAFQESQADDVSTGTSTNSAAAESTPPDIAPNIQQLDNAIIFHGEKGETVTGIDRNLPGADFPASITMFIRLLGVPVGLPLELVLLDWSKTNYSSARAALEQAFRMFRTWQRRLKQRWHTPIYLWKVQEWVDDGRLPNRPDIFKHEWIVPSFPWIDQLKEAMAWGERIDRGLATLTEAIKSLNQDREQWLIQRKREVADAIEAADELNGQYPNAKVDWRMFAGMGSAPKVSETLNGDAAGADEKAGDEKKDKKKKGKSGDAGDDETTADDGDGESENA